MLEIGDRDSVCHQWEATQILTPTDDVKLSLADRSRTGALLLSLVWSPKTLGRSDRALHTPSQDGPSPAARLRIALAALDGTCPAPSERVSLWISVVRYVIVFLPRCSYGGNPL